MGARFFRVQCQVAVSMEEAQREGRYWCGDPFLTIFVISTKTEGHLEKERVHPAYRSQTLMEGCQDRKSSRSSKQKPWWITAGWLPPRL